MKQRMGFTLIEMLVVVMIITMLAGLTLSAVGSARNAAAAARTRATIEKINRVVMKHYASYQYRKVDISGIPNVDTSKKTEVAKAKLKALRILIRQEMPDRRSDIYQMGTTLPALTQGYKKKIEGCKDPNNRDYLAAELLYMQVMADPVGAGMFSEGEIGDYDGDGLPEFLDGWGRPIRYILWPAGFFASSAKGCESDLQITTDIKSSKFAHDPFDTANTDLSMPALYPLIYSAGPDGIYDINIGKSDDDSTVLYNQYDPQPFMDSQSLLIGEPDKDDSKNASLHHYDNITNHSMLTNSN